MESERFLEVTPDGIAGGEAGELRVVLSGAEVVLADFGIVELAGEQEGIRQIVFVAVRFQLFTERAVSVEVLYRAVGVDYLPNTAQAAAQARRKGGL